MNDNETPAREECALARQTLQERMDGPLPAGRRKALDAHLAGCDECRDVRDGLDTVRAALQSLPTSPLPGDVLEEVWSRTLRDEPARWRGVAMGPRIAAMAALAASLLIVTLAVQWSNRLPSEQLTVAEIERVRQETRQVLEVTAQALWRSERTAMERVIEKEVSPAIRKIGIQWPEASSPSDRRSKT